MPRDSLTSLAAPADAMGMTPFHPTRATRSRDKFPPQPARVMTGDSAPVGGGAGPMEAWRLPAPKVMRNLVYGGRVLPRLCALVQHAGQSRSDAVSVV